MIYEQHILVAKLVGKDKLLTFDQDEIGSWIESWDLEDIEWIKPVKIQVPSLTAEK